MINRTLIRQKTIQVVYAYFLRQNVNEAAAEKELMFSLNKSFDLYHSLLLLLPEMLYFAQNRIEIRRAKLQPTEEDLNPNMRFVENRFLNQLAANKELNDYRAKMTRSWAEQPEFIRRLFEKVERDKVYKEYMAMPSSTYDEDRDFCRAIYKRFIVGNDELDDLFEEQSLYWNDDKTIVDTFVLKTFRLFEEANGEDQPLLPQFKAEDDKEFATILLHKAMSCREELTDICDSHLQNWDKERVAFMDRVIMVVALAEIMAFPTIPVNVTLNEYVEIARFYSTPKSVQFVNGVLDQAIKALDAEGRLIKTPIEKK